MLNETPSADGGQSGQSGLTIGFDIGGTNLRAAVIDASGEIIDSTSVPTATTARPGRISLRATVRLGSGGRVPPFGHEVIVVAAVGWTAVMLTTTADTPLAGTPPRFSTGRLRV